MTTLDKKKPTYAPAYVTGIYPQLAEKANEYGYALTLHGSVSRDLDLLAVPWVETAKAPIDLVKALCEVFDIQPNHGIREPEFFPHGRLGWSIPLWWGAYIDLCVMPLEREIPIVKEFLFVHQFSKSSIIYPENQFPEWVTSHPYRPWHDQHILMLEKGQSTESDFWTVWRIA